MGEIFFKELFKKEWLSPDEKDDGSGFISIYPYSYIGQVEPSYSYIAKFVLRDNYQVISFDFDIDSLQSKQEAIHKVRKLKQLISEFYNGLKSIPDETFQEEGEQQEE